MSLWLYTVKHYGIVCSYCQSGCRMGRCWWTCNVGKLVVGQYLPCRICYTGNKLRITMYPPHYCGLLCENLGPFSSSPSKTNVHQTWNSKRTLKHKLCSLSFLLTDCHATTLWHLFVCQYSVSMVMTIVNAKCLLSLSAIQSATVILLSSAD